jgi:hypothetical protein
LLKTRVAIRYTNAACLGHLTLQRTPKKEMSAAALVLFGIKPIAKKHLAKSPFIPRGSMLYRRRGVVLNLRFFSIRFATGKM